MIKKRKNHGEGRLTVDVILKDGDRTILEFRKKKASALEEVLETLKRKL